MFKNNPDELDQHFLIDKIVINNFIKERLKSSPLTKPIKVIIKNKVNK